MIGDLGQTQRKERLSTLRDYELVVIFSPQVADDDIDRQVERVSQWITGGGGEVTNVNRWGRNRLAYPINRFREGTYVAYQFQMRPEATSELERNIRLAEEIIRHLLVRMGE